MMVKRTFLLLILVLALLILTGCRTAEGMKEDITFIGDKTTEILDK
jgi:predicted small secreted protein